MNMNTHWRKLARTQSIGTLSTTLDVIRHTIDHSNNSDNDNANNGAINDTKNDTNNDTINDTNNGAINGAINDTINDANDEDSNIFSENNEFNITSLTIKINESESEVPFLVSNPPDNNNNNNNNKNNCIHILENYDNNSNYEARFGVFKNTNNSKNYFLTIFDSNRNIWFDSINTIQLNGKTQQEPQIYGYQISTTKIITPDGEEYIVYKTESSTLTISISYTQN